jgi:hypothetical protein
MAGGEGLQAHGRQAALADDARTLGGTRLILSTAFRIQRLTFFMGDWAGIAITLASQMRQE